jgi:gliding motility-associated-like protein
MKKITILFALLISYSAVPQDILMQDGIVKLCSGNFYDSGGSAGDYGSNQNFILTICPEIPGQLVKLNFTVFNTQITDLLSIYNGDSTAARLFGNFSGGPSNSPGFVSATAANPTGCLTIKFVSDASETITGWEAEISCFTPCQTINAKLDSASPTPNGDGYIRVCPNDPITLTGSGTFSSDGTGATYEWDLGDGNNIIGQTATFSYTLPGVYIVNLNIRDTNISPSKPLGCGNSNLIKQVIQVSTEPDFTGTQASQPIICYEDATTSIEGVVNPVEFINDCTPPVSGVTFLPDGNGVTYETSVSVDCYDSSQKLTDISQLASICITMEHSFLADLFIDIVSPNGQTVRMHNSGGETANLGIPWADGAIDFSSNTQPGVGYEYCFVPGNANPTLVGGVLPGGVFPKENGPGTYTDTYVPAGNYSSVNSFAGLLGSPLNGNWTIRVVDNLAQDNGYIFAWSIEFDPSLQPPELSFTPVITSEAWDADATIINTTGNTITVQPPTPGTYCYTYRVVDDFGCVYTKEVCIDMAPEIVSAEPNDLFLCNQGGPPNLLDLSQNTSIILAPASNPSDLVLTYHESQTDADSDSSPIGNPGFYDGTDGQIIYVRVEYQNSGCYTTGNFEIIMNPMPIFGLDDSYTLCVATNGTEVLDPPELDTGLSMEDYTFEWTLDGTVLPGVTGPSLTAMQDGIYGVLVTNIDTRCTNTDRAEVLASSPPTVEVEVVTQAFSENHVITATAIGDGEYEYSLDDGPWQSSGTFEDVYFGEHTVTARDINGCGQASGTVMLLDYPHFFTPNGDGRNETWNIVGFADQASAKIYIFDRFGKLLKQISPSGTGWNGTYNGKPMPTSDYWFTVEYSEPSTNEQKQFRAHFTLKR